MRRWRSDRWYAFAACAALAGAVLHAPAAPAQARLSLADALREALRQNPNTLLQQQQIVASRGAVLQAQGQFDPQVSANATRSRDLRRLRRDEINALERGGSSATDPLAALLGLTAQPGIEPISTQVTNNIAYTVGVEQGLQNGLVLGASVGITTVYDNISRANDIPPQTTGRISFNVRAPLLRNAGAEATTANLSAAEAEYAASRYDLVFTNAQTLLNTTLAYWDFLARYRRLEIARDAEQRSLRLVDETRKLIGADQLPAADIQIVLASYAERLGGRIGAEQSLAEARRALALQLGLPPERAAGLPLPADDFPAYDGQPLEAEKKVESLQQYALKRRADVEAGRQREQAARKRVVSARSGLKPQVDLSVGVNYGSLIENRVPLAVGYVLGANPIGPSITATLAAQMPWRNSAAEGTFLVASSSLDATLIRMKTLLDTIGANVSTGVQGLARSAQQLAQSMESTRYYGLSVENERTKRRLGLATLIDVINVEDRLTNALLAEVQARQAYANAIAQLRFELGTIVQQRGEQFDVVIDDLFNPLFDAP